MPPNNESRARSRPGRVFLRSTLPTMQQQSAPRCLSGAIAIRATASVDANGKPLEVPNAMVHHWRGAVLLRGLDVTSLIAILESDAPDTGQEDVLRVSVLNRGPDTMTVFLKVRRTKFVTAVYNTEHARQVSSRLSGARVERERRDQDCGTGRREHTRRTRSCRPARTGAFSGGGTRTGVTSRSPVESSPSANR